MTPEAPFIHIETEADFAAAFGAPVAHPTLAQRLRRAIARRLRK